MIQEMAFGFIIGSMVSLFIYHIKREDEIINLKFDIRKAKDEKRIAEYDRNQMEIDRDVSRDRADRLADRINELLVKINEYEETYK